MGSPRRGGNSHRLLNRALEGARGAGAETEEIVLIDLDIAPCRECGGCAEGEPCVVNDDMPPLLSRITSADGLIVAAPLFFCGVPAHTKAMIDRCQPIWSRKQRAPSDPLMPQRRAASICTGGAHGKSNFTGAQLTLRAFFATLGFVVVDEVEIDGLEARNDVLRRPEALERALWAGRRVASRV